MCFCLQLSSSVSFFTEINQASRNQESFMHVQGGMRVRLFVFTINLYVCDFPKLIDLKSFEGIKTYILLLGSPSEHCFYMRKCLILD
ncbi:hypothetical protein PVAP13_8KG391130 [Panicum virgatum]|uniref:Uncharacterized protein n=1 Tax=Panicum virgatum TaxID=38727 RepID=A0A8T0PTF7_PANVG|nr:hypothetical protein PVAP13_8KG391130 [Panicum virgatum]